MEQAKERWGEAEIITNAVDAEEERERELRMMDYNHKGSRGKAIARTVKSRDTKKKVDAQKRKNKRKQQRKSRRAA